MTSWLGVAVEVRNLAPAVILAALLSSGVRVAWDLVDPLRRLSKVEQTKPEPKSRRETEPAPNDFLGDLLLNYIANFFSGLLAAFVIAISLGIVRIAENSFFSFDTGVAGGVVIAIAVWMASLAATLGSKPNSQIPPGETLRIGLNAVLSLLSYLVIGLVVGALLDVTPLVMP